jgi:hypothetical protein
MGTDETEIYEFLKSFRAVYVSVTEVSRRLGARRKFNLDRAWARPILIRMELDGLVESNEYGEFRIKDQASETDFKTAVTMADSQVPLGETTIIRLRDTED